MIQIGLIRTSIEALICWNKVCLAVLIGCKLSDRIKCQILNHTCFACFHSYHHLKIWNINVQYFVMSLKLKHCLIRTSKRDVRGSVSVRNWLKKKLRKNRKGNVRTSGRLLGLSVHFTVSLMHKVSRNVAKLRI